MHESGMGMLLMTSSPLKTLCNLLRGSTSVSEVPLQGEGAKLSCHGNMAMILSWPDGLPASV